MSKRALVVGSGPGGSVAAMVLARAGWDVTVFEKGPNYFTDLTSDRPGTVFSNDELKMNRAFSLPDPTAEPRVYRSSPESQSLTGSVEALPQTVGGGAVHWDAKTPRFWDIDFKKLSMLGPVKGAEISDWPFEYGDLSAYYDEIEALIGASWEMSACSRKSRLSLTLRGQGPCPCRRDRPSTPHLSFRRVAGTSDFTPSLLQWPSTPSPTRAAPAATTAASARATDVRSSPASAPSPPCARRCALEQSCVPTPWS